LPYAELLGIPKMQSNKAKLSGNQRILSAVCIVLFVCSLLLTLFRPSFFAVDVAVNLWIPSIQSGTASIFAEAIALIFDTTSIVLISLLISGALFLKNRKAQSLFLLGAMGGVALIVETIKIFNHVARPTNSILLDSGFSYPSGHSAGIVVFGGVLVYFAWRHYRNKRPRVLIGTGLVALVGVVGFDRLYLNVHWLSDVFGGLLFGVFWLSFVVLLFEQLEIAGKFQCERFDLVANLLYIAAVVVSVLVVLSGFVV